MPTVYDNIETPFLENDSGIGLKDALKLARQGDFCVGYFNLRGWRCIDSLVSGWEKPTSEDQPGPCRLLVGMQRLAPDLIKDWLDDSDPRPPTTGSLPNSARKPPGNFGGNSQSAFPPTPMRPASAAWPVNSARGAFR